MKPSSLSTVKLTEPKRPKFAPGSLEARHGQFRKGTVLPETIVRACPRVKVEEFPDGFLKSSHIEGMEHNQKIASCCRHPENHEVEAFKSHPEEQAPDIYIFHCKCGKRHTFFCVGKTDERPVWSAS